MVMSVKDKVILLQVGVSKSILHHFHCQVDTATALISKVLVVSVQRVYKDSIATQSKLAICTQSSSSYYTYTVAR